MSHPVMSLRVHYMNNVPELARDIVQLYPELARDIVAVMSRACEGHNCVIDRSGITVVPTLQYYLFSI